MKFPKRLRTMTVAEFASDYNGNVLLASARKSVATGARSAVPSTPVQANGRAVAATPLTARSMHKRRELALLAAQRRGAPNLDAFKLQLKTASGAQLDLYAWLCVARFSVLLNTARSATLGQSQAAKSSAREQIRLLQQQLNGLMNDLASPAQ